MFCKKCGNILNDNAKFCNACGAAQEPERGEEATTLNPQHSTHYAHQVDFLTAIKLFFTRYTDFQGRSRRSEYWWVVLFNCLASGIISAILGDLGWIWTVVTFVPGIALAVRRLHDVGKSGWWYLWVLLPFVGQIILLIQFCKDSAPENQWGPNPKCVCE